MPISQKLMAPTGLSWSALRKGMFAYYNFDTFDDASGNMRHLDTYLPFSNQAGRVGLCVVTGDEQSMACWGGESTANWTGITIAGWFRVGPSAPGNGAVFTCPNLNLEISHAYANLNAVICGLAFSVNCEADDGDWKFICLRRNSAATKFLASTGEFTDDGGAVVSPMSGGYCFGYNQFDDHVGQPDAWFDAWGIWSRYLSDAEIGWLYNVGTGRELPALFDVLVDSTGDALIDSTNNPLRTS